MDTPTYRADAGESDSAKGAAGAIVPRMKILVIEDDLEAAAYMTKAFREAGIVVDHASDGESGLFMGSGNEGLSISSKTLAALGLRSIELSLDIYSIDDDSDATV
jgi:DNA-binding NtrC family response regulator